MRNDPAMKVCTMDALTEEYFMDALCTKLVV
jgi:hypothetical protein